MHTMTTTSSGVPERSLRNDLAYNEMTMGANGSVMNREEKQSLRARYGYCTECEGLPTLLYVVKKSRLNPLWVTKEPRAVAGECSGGVCFVCYPDQDPRRRHRQPRYSDAQGAGSSRGPRPNFGSRQSRSIRGPRIPTAVVEPVAAPAAFEAVREEAPQAPASTPPAQPPPATAAPARRPSHTSPRTMVSPRSTRPKVRQSSFPGVFVPDVMKEAAQPEEFSAISQSERGGSDTMERFHASAPLSESSRMNNTEREERSFRSHTADSEERSCRHTTAERDEMPMISDDASSRQMDRAMQEESDNSLSRRGEQGFSTGSDHSELGSLRSTPQRPTMPPQEGSFSSQSFGHTSQADSAQPSFGMASVGPGPHTATIAASHLSEREVDGIIDGVDSLIRDMIDIPGNSELLAGIILGTMSEHVHVPAVQTYCLRMIWDTCKDNDENKDALMASGAPVKIIEAMDAFPDSPSVQEKACGAIWSLGVSSNNRVVLIRAQACQHVVQAMKSFMSTESLVRTAIGALRTLSPEMEARDLLITLGSQKIVVQTMVSHRQCISVQRDGCAFLSNCAVDIEKQVVKVVPYEELNAVVQAMFYHKTEISVMQGACFALKNYTHEESNCRTIRQCKGVDDLIQYASTYEESPSCMENAADILERLQMSRMMDESIEEQAYMELIRFADSESNKTIVQRKISEVLSDFGWSPRMISISLQILGKIIREDVSQRDQLCASGVLEDVLLVCDKLARDERVCAEGCSVVACLADDPNKHDLLLEAGASQLVFKSLEHTTNEDVVKSALEALSVLSNNNKWFQETKENMSLVAEAHASHPTSDSVQISYLSLISRLDT
mmetsp:Transcript_124811/g.186461  ORF Transcript_124811/g.186461 Transcript_124811/m.186461 type:complete len:841 (+) Transcript_124811:30-2552(+)